MKNEATFFCGIYALPHGKCIKILNIFSFQFTCEYNLIPEVCNDYLIPASYERYSLSLQFKQKTEKFKFKCNLLEQ